MSRWRQGGPSGLDSRLYLCPSAVLYSPVQNDGCTLRRAFCLLSFDISTGTILPMYCSFISNYSSRHDQKVKRILFCLAYYSVYSWHTRPYRSPGSQGLMSDHWWVQNCIVQYSIVLHSLTACVACTVVLAVPSGWRMQINESWIERKRRGMVPALLYHWTLDAAYQPFAFTRVLQAPARHLQVE